MLHHNPWSKCLPGRVSKSLQGRRSSSERGVTMLEVLVAVAILGLCLLFMTQLLVQDFLVEQRTRSRVASLRLLEAHAELIRAGLPMPDTPGRYTMELLVEPPAGSGVVASAIELDMEELEPEGLWAVRLELSYQTAGRTLEQSMEMRLWRP